MAIKKRKKVVDKWKSKKWYEVIAPKMFNSKAVGEAVTADEKNLINRIVITSLRELEVSQDAGRRLFSNIKVRLRITEVKGKTANTRYIGHEILTSYFKTLARKGRSVIEVIVDESTKDGEKVRIKTVAVTGSNVSYNTKKNIRAAMRETIKEIINTTNFEDLVMDSLQGKVTGKVYNRLKQITKMMKVEIKKLSRKETFR